MARLALVQGLYYLVTGLWPFASERTFVLVTGPKHDMWLVKTIGALLGAVGTALVLAGSRRRTSAEVGVVAVGTAASLGGADFVYGLRGRIPPVYVAEGAVEAGFGAAWAILTLRRRR